MSVRKVFLVVAGLMAMSSAWAADVTGSWAMTVESPMGTGNPSFNLEQKGEAVTGTYKGQLGEAKVNGTVKGNDITLNYSIDAQGQSLTITYKGTVDGNNMTGKVSFGEMGEGSFKGTKQ